MKQHEMPLADLGRRTVLGAGRRWQQRNRGWPRRRSRPVAVAAAVAMVIAAGCGSSKGSPGATVPEPTTSTTISVATVPDTITVEYAQAVMDELDRVLGDAIRELVAAQGPSDAFIARLKAVYAEPQYTKEVDLYGEDAANEFKGYRIPPGDPKTIVKEIIDSSNFCIVARVDKDLSSVFSDGADSSAAGILEVRLKDRSRDPAGENRTAWMIFGDGPEVGATIPENPCA